MNKIINSDALEALRTLPDSCCRTCIPAYKSPVQSAERRKHRETPGRNQ